MKAPRRRNMLVVLFIGVGLAGFAAVVLLMRASPPTIRGYQDADGWVYQCSRPLAAKEGTSMALGHPLGLVPIKESEASKYCHKIGIE